jgi:hypothetical protein
MRPINERSVLRQLEPGHFTAFGPALGYELDDIAVEPVRTWHGILEAYVGTPVTPSMTNEALAASLLAGAQSDPAAASDAAEGESCADRPLDEGRLLHAVIEFALHHGMAHTAGVSSNMRGAASMVGSPRRLAMRRTARGGVHQMVWTPPNPSSLTAGP